MEELRPLLPVSPRWYLEETRYRTFDSYIRSTPYLLPFKHPLTWKIRGISPTMVGLILNERRRRGNFAESMEEKLGG